MIQLIVLIERIAWWALVKASRFVYGPIRIEGLDCMPQSGGALLACNHVTFADAALLLINSPRPIRFIGGSHMLSFPWGRWAYRRFGVIPISPFNARAALSKAIEAVNAGEVVCIFPEGQLTKDGRLLPFKKGLEFVARNVGAPVVPVYLSGMWGSVFSHADRPLAFRSSMPLRRRIRLRFGEPMTSTNGITEEVKRRIGDLGRRPGYDPEHDAPDFEYAPPKVM